MKPPYSPNEHLAWIDPDPDGIRVYQATVIHVSAATKPQHWLVRTDRGSAVVDQNGESGHIVPIDIDIATELYLKGDGYLILPTLIDQQHTFERHSNSAGLDHDTDLGDDLDFD